MNAIEIDSILGPTLADGKIAISERKMLSAWVTRNIRDDNQLALVRNRAFELAKATLNEGRASMILDWLDDVVKILHKPDGNDPTEVQSQAFFAPGDDCIREVNRQFKFAERSCDVCVFTITDDRITREIIGAHHRGVKVRVITDDDKAHDLGSDIDQLAEVGIPVKIDRSPFHMHHKFSLFDATRLLTGSFNWTRSATENNEENLIVTNDVRLVNAFIQRFEQLWNKLENV